MIELMQFLREKGFEPGDIALDGEIHRFGRNGKPDNAWLIGWRNHSMKTGQAYEVCVFGDWRTGEEHKYLPEKELSKEDKAAVKAQMEAATKKRAEDRVKRQVVASEKADKLWRSAGDVFDAPYYARKQIAKSYGTKTMNGTEGRVVLIPMRDVEGKLWGLQRIFADGQKRFLSGQKVEGTFHLIGGEPVGELLICEGFATGASLFEATGLPVACAFNAQNLLSVAQSLRKKFPDAAITICGDDDRWTVDPLTGEPMNTGRDKAQKAALLCQGGMVFPEFASLEDKPTDFNDLHVREGIAAVKKHFAEPVSADKGFIPLGFNKATDFYYSIEAKDVVEVSTYSEVQMLRLAPPDYWYAYYPSKLGIDWRAAKSDLIQKSKAVGPFDSSRIRGTGVWLDEGRVVVNTGHSLTVDGRPMALPGIRSWHVYVQTINRMPPLRDDPLTAAECGPLIDACSLLNWKDPKSALYLAGWLAIARVAGALPVRPHVWLTGGAGTGKSTVMDRLVAPALGSRKGKKYVQGGSTEAGIRQEVQSSSVPVIFDEFETTNEGSRERVQALVELLRQSWSTTQGSVVKGSTSGTSVQYQLGFAALVSSIRINLDNDADRSRFSILELAPHGAGDRWPELQKALKAINDDYGERLFARAARMVRVIAASQKTLSDALAVVMGQRFAQQHASLLAGYFSLLQDEPVSTEQAEAAARELDLAEERDAIGVTDERECLERILTTKVTIRDGVGNVKEETIGEIIAQGSKSELVALKTYGVLVDADAIFIANRHAELGKIFNRTRWGDWARSLKRLPGAEASKPKWFGDTAQRAVRIPRSSL